MKLVTVIIPTYNVELYIKDCLESILNQTYKNIEIIVMDDGSKDRTALIVKEYQKKYSNITLYENENHGQGYERNRAIEKATGEYILFVDSDDFIELDTIEESVKKIEKENSDLVMFDWKYYNHRTQRYNYNTTELVYAEKILENNDTLKILKLTAYFSVNKLYRRSFLVDNNIKYMENYIYEDNPFWVEVAIKANRISILQKPFYNVRIGNPSSTRSNRSTDFHAKSFIAAVNRIQEIVKENNVDNGKIQYTYNYLFKKFQNYRRERVPKHLRKQFTKDYLHALKDAKIYENYTGKVMKLLYKLNVFKKEKYLTFNLVVGSKTFAKRLKKKLKAIKENKKNIDTQDLILPEKMKNKVVLFMGFDYRYTGNSRYLFEDIIEKNPDDISIYFATNDTLVDEKYRIEPKSEIHKSLLKVADIVVFESWIPQYVVKQEGQIWLQLWHGTPLKKMLFDSNEKEVMEKNKKHKVTKYNDIAKWDYLLADSKEGQKYFHSPFLISNEKILPIGYPRVKYLIDNINNKKLKNKLKEEYDIPKDKIIVSYLPTWRDYNYNKKDEDFGYMIDVEKIQEQLGDKYKVIFKDHTFLSKNDKLLKMETQDLLLISDYLLTDYSSVMFDAFAIDLKTILYCNDYDKYQKSRGVYDEMWNDLKPLVVDNYEDMISLIKKYTKSKEMKTIDEKYGYNGSYKRNLGDMVINYFNKDVYNPFKKTYLLVTGESYNEETIYEKVKELNKDGFEVFVALKEDNEVIKLFAKTLVIKNESEIDELQKIYNFYEKENI